MFWNQTKIHVPKAIPSKMTTKAELGVVTALIFTFLGEPREIVCIPLSSYTRSHLAFFFPTSKVGKKMLASGCIWQYIIQMKK